MDVDAQLPVCKQGTVSWNRKKEFSFVEYRTTQSFEEMLRELRKLGTTSLTVTSLSISETDWMTDVAVYIKPSNNSLPTILLGKSHDSHRLDLYISKQDTLSYFLQGEVDFIYKINGKFPKSGSLTSEFCLEANIE
jgi:hypothetical protein